jgi:hypothetical protein
LFWKLSTSWLYDKGPPALLHHPGHGAGLPPPNDQIWIDTAFPGSELTSAPILQ